MANVTGRKTFGDVQILEYDGDPSGVNAAPIGSLGLDTTSGVVYVNNNGSTSWSTLQVPGWLPPITSSPWLVWSPAESLVRLRGSAGASPSNNNLSSAGRQVYGLEAILFNGSSSYVGCGSLARQANWTAFIVAENDNTNDQIFIGMGEATGATAKLGMHLGINGGNWIAAYGDDTDFRLTTFQAVGSGSRLVATFRHADGDADVEMWLNGASQGVSATLGSATSSAGANRQLDIGKEGDRAAGYMAGTMCEVIIYNAALSAPDRSDVEDALQARWGV